MSVAQQRLFIAAELPDDLRQELAALQQRLRHDNPPVRWVEPSAMHLTLWFLGDVDVDRIPALATTLNHAFQRQHPATVRLGHVGAFPNLRRPTVVWVGFAAGEDGVRQWYADLVRPLGVLGFSADIRGFQPHLTLGRVRREASAEQQSRLGLTIQQTAVHARHEWLLRHITLFQSELRPEGSRYTSLATVELL